MLGLVRSLYYNELGAEGAKHLSEALKMNSTLKDLKYAQPELQPTVSAPSNIACPTLSAASEQTI